MKDKVDIFVGTCVIEGEDFTLKVAESLQRELAPFAQQILFTYKGSFDKANRTSKDSFRGLGLEEGLRVLEKVKSTLGLPVVTDYHLPAQAQAVAQVVDTLQVPAFLCRQTDMIEAGAKACAQYGRRPQGQKGPIPLPLGSGKHYS